MKKGDVDCEHLFRFKQTNKQTRQLHLLPPGHRRRSLCQAPLRRWDSPPQAPLALTRSTSQGLGVPGRHRDPGPGASLHKHSHTSSSTYSEEQLTKRPEHGSGCKWPTCTLAQLSPRCGGCAFCTRGLSTRDLSGAPLNAGVELQRRPAARRCRHQRMSGWERERLHRNFIGGCHHCGYHRH